MIILVMHLRLQGSYINNDCVELFYHFIAQLKLLPLFCNPDSYEGVLETVSISIFQV